MNELQAFDYSQLSTAELPVHPAADIFPMMSEEELVDLAEDIKANGLVHPLIIDAAGQLIDGRNRLAACKLAGVEPRFEQLNGRDPLAYIASANLKRRNLTKGQQAMALAMIYPEARSAGAAKRTRRKMRPNRPLLATGELRKHGRSCLLAPDGRDGYQRLIRSTRRSQRSRKTAAVR